MQEARNITMLGRKKMRALVGSGSVGSNFTYINSSTELLSATTVDMWCKPNAYPTHGALFNFTSSENYNTGGTGLGIGFGASSSFETDGTYLNFLYNSIAWKPVKTLNYDGWHHVAFSVNPSGNNRQATSRIYFDGELLASNSAGLLSRIDRIQLLGYSAAAGMERYFTGMAAEICIHPSILTDTQVAARYAEGLSAPSSFIGISHYWNGKMRNGKVADMIGSWDLTINGDASIGIV